MIDFSVCIELAFTEADPLIPDRVRAAADAGFQAVEIWDWRDKPLQDLSKALAETGTQLLTICAEHWRDKCQLADPASHAEFVRRVADTAKIAAELGVPKIVVLAGDILPESDIAAQRAAASDALLRASDAVAREPVELLVEVVNRQFEGPNALLPDSTTAIDLIRRLDRPNVRFLYDRYHAILNDEPLGWAVGTNLDLVGHIQAADVPRRHEFGTGDQDWVRELRWLLDAGYAGHVGIEAIPLNGSADLYRGARALLEAAAAKI